MNSPSVWTCDKCSNDVTLNGLGLVAARHDSADPNRLLQDWKIVHKNTCDPGASAGYVTSLDVERLVGPAGQAQLLSLLSAGPLMNSGPSNRIGDFDAFVDVFRRLHTPFYEEARLQFSEPDVQHRFSDSNQYHPYIPEVLETIVKDRD